MHVDSAIQLNDQSYDVKLKYLVKNYGNVNLRNVSVSQSLKDLITSSSSYTVKSSKLLYGFIQLNNQFDGNIDTNLLTRNSILSLADSASFEVMLNVKPRQGGNIFTLQSLASAVSIPDELITTDKSTNGNNPDPSGDNIPEESVVSRINIDVPIEVLETGEIAILGNRRGSVSRISFCDEAAAFKVLQITPNSGGAEAYTYQWEISTDNVAYSKMASTEDSVATLSGFKESTYLRRKLISGDQWAYSNPVFIQINKAVKPVITSSARSLDNSNTVTLQSTAALEYSWSTNQTSPSIVISNAGRYAVKVIDDNGCEATSDTIVIAPSRPVSNKVTYILGAIDNPATINNAVRPTVDNASLRFYSQMIGGVRIATPSLPNAVGKFNYFVTQEVDGIESSMLPLEITIIDPVTLFSIEKVVSKQPALQADASFLLGFDFNLSNLKNEKIADIDLVDDLSKVFPSKAVVEVVSLKATGKLKPNTFYNGYAHKGLLASGSEMEGNAKDTVRLILRVYPNGYVGEIKNIAQQTMTSPIGSFRMSSYDSKVTGAVQTITGASTSIWIPEVSIIIPTGFSPNRDGQNDTYVIVRPYNVNIGLEIFDRTGGLVYKSQDYKNDWDGRSNQRSAILGKDLPDGTYFYIVTATDRITGKVSKFNHYLTMKR